MMTVSLGSRRALQGARPVMLGLRGRRVFKEKLAHKVKREILVIKVILANKALKGSEEKRGHRVNRAYRERKVRRETRETREMTVQA